MNTTEERIERIHKRAKELEEERKKRILGIEGAVTAALGICLIVMVAFLGVNGGGLTVSTVTDTGLAGASLLEPGAGSYIIVALVAFMFGVALTVLIRSLRDRGRRDIEEHGHLDDRDV